LVVIVAVPAGPAVPTPFAGPELSPRLGPVEKVIGKLRQEMFIDGLAPDPGAATLLFGGRIRLLGPRRPMPGRVSSVSFANDVRHAVAPGV
jgi:hypothetical protein